MTTRKYRSILAPSEKVEAETLAGEIAVLSLYAVLGAIVYMMIRGII